MADTLVAAHTRLQCVLSGTAPPACVPFYFSLPKGFFKVAIMEKRISILIKEFSGILLLSTLVGCGDDSSPTNEQYPSSEWLAAEVIGTNADAPQIAVDAEGNAVVVFERSGINTTDVGAVIYTPGVGWGSVELIETNDEGPAWNPAVAMDTNGNAIAAWVQQSAAPDQRSYLWTNYYTKGSGWGIPEQMSTGAPGNAYSPQIAFDPNGNAIIVWEQSMLETGNVWVNRYVAGSGWGTAQALQPSDAIAAGYADLAIDDNGRALVVWSQIDAIEGNIWAARFDSATGWNVPELIEERTGDAGLPQVATDAAGNAIAVWQQSDGNARYDIWSNRFSPDTGWGTAVLVETKEGDARSPQVALGSNGVGGAVWVQSDGTSDNILGREFSGSKWGNIHTLDSHPGDAFLPRIAVDDTGHPVVVWTQFDVDRNSIWANQHLDGSSVAAPVETEIAGDAGVAQIAVYGPGKAIAVWSSRTGDQSDISANNLD